MTKPCFPVQWTVYDAKLEKPLVLYTKKGIPICPCNCACIDKYEIHEANEKGEPGKQLGEVKCHFSFPNCGAKAYDADKKELSYLGSNYKVPECIKLCLLNRCCGLCICVCPTKHLVDTNISNDPKGRVVNYGTIVTRCLPCLCPTHSI